ncbi:MAG: 2-hydroxyacyl-CoA dehydratase [Chloroflexi bacterium]|nr:2-hydroxyacyl-CoA dehydratase [Chloroflexota bacterium]
MAIAESTTGLLGRFRQVNNAFPQTAQIKEIKASGGKVFGWLCSYVPEELIYAAGALPVRVTGYPHETELADGTAYLSTVSCSFSRSCLQIALRGEYSSLDGIIAGSTCDGARRLFDHWRRYVKTPFAQIISVPRKYSATTLDLYYSEIVSLKASLEKYLGTSITDDALANAISVYNRSRAIMGRLYELRMRDGPPLTGAEMLEVTNAAVRIPRDTFNAWAGELLAYLETSPVRHRGRARIMVIGSVLNNVSFIESIEAGGALVVTDGLCTGIRYLADPVVREDSELPLRSIARRYLTGFPCARMFPAHDRFDRIVKLLQDYRVDGIISENIRYCVQNAHDLPLLRQMVSALGIPILALDIEYGTSGSGQIQTRVQAFLEMIEASRRRPVER